MHSFSSSSLYINPDLPKGLKIPVFDGFGDLLFTRNPSRPRTLGNAETKKNEGQKKRSEQLFGEVTARGLDSVKLLLNTPTGKFEWEQANTSLWYRVLSNL